MFCLDNVSGVIDPVMAYRRSRWSVKVQPGQGNAGDPRRAIIDRSSHGTAGRRWFIPAPRWPGSVKHFFTGAMWSTLCESQVTGAVLNLFYRTGANGCRKKLSPRAQWRNPVMLWLRGRQRANHLVNTAMVQDNREAPCLQGDRLWLWFTALVRQFAEALAEGRSKARPKGEKRVRSSRLRAPRQRCAVSITYYRRTAERRHCPSKRRYYSLRRRGHRRRRSVDAVCALPANPRL